MDKNKDRFNKLSREELIKLINIYEEKIAVTDECRDLLRMNSRCCN